VTYAAEAKKTLAKREVSRIKTTEIRLLRSLVVGKTRERYENEDVWKSQTDKN
jgi:hypothetical protein